MTLEMLEPLQFVFGVHLSGLQLVAVGVEALPLSLEFPENTTALLQFAVPLH